eukprot:6428554-Prymnesium_polylepis.2
MWHRLVQWGAVRGACGGCRNSRGRPYLYDAEPDAPFETYQLPASISASGIAESVLGSRTRLPSEDPWGPSGGARGAVICGDAASRREPRRPYETFLSSRLPFSARPLRQQPSALPLAHVGL